MTEKIIESLTLNSKGDHPLPLAKYAIGFALNLRTTVIKEGIRGYRNGLIEIGAACQAFKESCHEMDFSEYCSFLFNDFVAGFESNLNIRNLPLILVQWFGKKGN
ncbi:conserved protein of unknown function [Oenococcus oeni]|nr:hypothetical protein [Oenococcus oeni]AVI94939.1 hypothetical protein AX764_09055 [Oenococcus oeni]SYV98576.1 conserved hypothetical protein [Oenococcus oeni]SYW05208.1 conserved hypothetical protein [Oenococcus oeni]SYW19037.1 conserved hypothetical protein [Oenococcus oeni]VDC15582.1 conserved protein of unknown function [Oenococcus oeni]